MNALRRLLLALYQEHCRAPGQALLMLLGLSLSVAVVVAIDVSIDSAQSAFTDARRTLSGAATHQIISDADPVPQSLLAELRQQGLRRSAPVIDLEAIHAADGRRLRLFGIDPISELQMRPWLSGDSGDSEDQAISFRQLIGDADGILIGSGMARQLGLQAHSALRLRVDGRDLEFVVRGLIADDAIPPAAREWVILDMAAAQRALHGSGYSRIDLQIDLPTAERIARTLPGGLRLLATTEQDTQLASMSRAFEINLKALSLLALLVGLFVVFQTLSFLTLRRAPTIGLWRALGVGRRLLATVLLTEAALVGLIAALVGIALGMVLGRLLLVGIDGTYAELYGRGASGGLSIAPWLWVKALGLSMLGALVAVTLPLLDVLGKSTLSALGRSSETDAAASAQARRIRGLALPSLLLLALGAALLKLGPENLGNAFVALFICLIAALGLVPWLAYGMLLLMESGLRGGRVLPQWLLAGSRRGLGRTGIALAALCLAIATVIGMSSMIHSFRSAVSQWIDRSLQADVYVSARGRGALPPSLIAAASALPGVRHLSQTRRSQRLLDSGPIDVVGLDLPAEARDGFDWISADTEHVWLQFAAGDALISEPLATRLKLQVGDDLALPGAQGLAPVRIAAIYRDYASSQGVLTLRLDEYRKRFADGAVGAIGVYADPGSMAPMTLALEALSADQPGVQVVSAASIRERTLAVFARTFAVTDLLRLLAGLIAIVAVVGALSALAIERQREFALLRSLGLSAARLLRLQWLQASLLGLIAGLLALPIGIALALLLIEVINRRSFGWSMQLQLPWDQLLTATAVAVVSAMLAGTLPARTQRRQTLAQQLRESPL
ncbi:MAG: ABC transporter permease [Lysobacterales bacterium]